MRKMTAEQSMAKVGEANAKTNLENLKAKLAEANSVEEAGTYRKMIDSAMVKLDASTADFNKAKAQSEGMLDTVRAEGEAVLAAKTNANEAKVKLSTSVADTRKAKIMVAKVDSLKAEETVKNARAARTKTMEALEKAMEGGKKIEAAQLKELLANVENVINQARGTLEENRKIMMEDQAESIQAEEKNQTGQGRRGQQCDIRGGSPEEQNARTRDSDHKRTEGA